ncbi:MAG: RteC domain-containing protein [Labilibaculum antarcticum]
MFKEEIFFRLISELTKAVVVFEKNEVEYKLYFDKYLSFHEFKDNVNHLYWNFIREVRNNLYSFKTNGEVRSYLDMLIHIFEMLDEQIGENPDFVNPSPNYKIVTKTINRLEWIHIHPEDLSQMVACFQLQKGIIQKSSKFIRVFRKNCRKSEVYLLGPDASWQNEMKEFYPHMTRIKDVLPMHKLLPDKIYFLHEERQRLSVEYLGKGEDIYSSPANMYFEVKIETYRGLLCESQYNDFRGEDFKDKEIKALFLEMQSILDQPNSSEFLQDFKNDFKKMIEKFKRISNGSKPTNCSGRSSVNLRWTDKKVALVELIYALFCSNSLNDGNAEIKEITNSFENLFSVDLGDVYHAFLEIRGRKIEPTKFLDLLKDSLLNKIKELKDN